MNEVSEVKTCGLVQQLLLCMLKILPRSRATRICWMEGNPDDHLLKVLDCLLLYSESNQVFANFLLSLLTLLSVYLHSQTLFVIFSGYRF